MKRYRITTNGENFRVQHRVKFGPLDFWRTDYFYEVTESYPKVVKRRVEFPTLEEAERYVAARLKETTPHQPKKSGRWKVVRKYSDKRRNLSPAGETKQDGWQGGTPQNASGPLPP